MSRSQTDYIRRSRIDQEPLVEVTFDVDDGAIERVALYCEISDSWLPIEGELPFSLDLKVKEFVNSWLETHREAV